MGIIGPRIPYCNRVNPKPPTMTVGPFKKNKRPMQCYRCLGWGHSWKDLPTPENFDWGKWRPFSLQILLHRISCLNPPRQLQTQVPPNPIAPKQASDRNQYYNPDPLLHLIGEANEASVYVDGVECTALIDSGAQISTIT